MNATGNMIINKVSSLIIPASKIITINFANPAVSNRTYNFIDTSNSDICLTNTGQTYSDSNIYTNNIAIYFHGSVNTNISC
jgi:hypothetical protein